MLRQANLEQYAADEPLVCTRAGFAVFDRDDWDTSSRWISTLAGLQASPVGLVLPLEISVPGWNRVDLYGLELLLNLRWSAPDGIRGIPVLALAWQPVLDILRKRTEMLLIRPAVEFQRLPHIAGHVRGFLQRVSVGELPSASISEIEQTAGSGSLLASRVSYHDLANDYYAAFRLWKGYRALLKQASDSGGRAAALSRAEMQRIESVHYGWESSLQERLSSALVRQFQALRASAQVPRYPTVATVAEVLSHHLESGLSTDTRVLVVDDEFDKGMAEVLLQILFRKADFTGRTGDEWVYAEPGGQPGAQWARLVCVRSAELARNWLVHWGELPEGCLSSQTVWEDWLARWYATLVGGRPPSKITDSEDVLGENRGVILDSRRAAPRLPHTVMLLDLRLRPVTESLYSIREFPSVELRTAIKAHKPELPIIMFTASRQIMNSAEILDSTREIDGWLVKEGPDIPVDSDDSNSASATAYLLERIHLYSTLASWYREPFGWETKRKLECARLYNSAHAARLLEEISGIAAAILGEIRARSARCSPGDTFLSYIQARVPSKPFAVAQTLVARRVAIAVLLLSADVRDGSIEWNAEAFDGVLPGRPAKKLVIAPYDKINFNQVLWMRSSDPLSQLLREEFDWLAAQEWPEDRRELILRRLVRERDLLDYQQMPGTATIHPAKN